MNIVVCKDQIETFKNVSVHVHESRKNIEERKIYIAISGGNTPQGLFDYWATQTTEIPWNRIVIFWVDERCVSPNSDQSNYFNAFEHFIKPLKIEDSQIFRIKGEIDPSLEAHHYSDIVENEVPLFNGVPRFDFILLGIGNDGHTASLFPEDIPRLNNTNSLYIVTENPENHVKRITMTFELINNCSDIMFVVMGEGKKGILKKIFNRRKNKTGVIIPASEVKPKEGLVTYYIDLEASPL